MLKALASSAVAAASEDDDDDKRLPVASDNAVETEKDARGRRRTRKRRLRVRFEDRPNEWAAIKTDRELRKHDLGHVSGVDHLAVRGPDGRPVAERGQRQDPGGEEGDKEEDARIGAVETYRLIKQPTRTDNRACIVFDPHVLACFSRRNRRPSRREVLIHTRAGRQPLCAGRCLHFRPHLDALFLLLFDTLGFRSLSLSLSL